MVSAGMAIMLQRPDELEFFIFIYWNTISQDDDKYNILI